MCRSGCSLSIADPPRPTSSMSSTCQEVRFRQPTAAWSASGPNSKAAKPVSDPGDVVGVVRTDVNLHQPAHRRVHDPQLPAPVAGVEPAVMLWDQPELGVVRGGLGDVRNADDD